MYITNHVQRSGFTAQKDRTKLSSCDNQRSPCSRHDSPKRAEGCQASLAEFPRFALVRLDRRLPDAETSLPSFCWCASAGCVVAMLCRFWSVICCTAAAAVLVELGRLDRCCSVRSVACCACCSLTSRSLVSLPGDELLGPSSMVLVATGTCAGSADRGGSAFLRLLLAVCLALVFFVFFLRRNSDNTYKYNDQKHRTKGSATVKIGQDPRSSRAVQAFPELRPRLRLRGVLPWPDSVTPLPSCAGEGFGGAVAVSFFFFFFFFFFFLLISRSLRASKVLRFQQQ